VHNRGLFSPIVPTFVNDITKPNSTPADDHALAHDTRLQAILSSSVDGVVIINGQGQIESFNRAAERMFGYKSKEVIGRDVSILMPDTYAKDHRKRVRAYVETRKSNAIGVHREVTGRKKDGTTFPLDIALGIAEFGDRNLITGIVRDITERKNIEQELENYRLRLERMVWEKTRKLEELNRDLERLSRIDGLTDIFNRRYFDESLDRELRRASRLRESVVLILCDVDCFKQYNDSYGHLAGDHCLKNIAAMIRACCRRETDIVARYGGEEFAVLFPDTEDAGSRRAEQIRQQIWAMKIPHQGSCIADRVSVSLGVASTAPGKRISPHALIERADRALYAAKNSGRNKVVVAANEAECKPSATPDKIVSQG